MWVNPKNPIYDYHYLHDKDVIVVDGVTYSAEFIYSVSPYLCIELGFPKQPEPYAILYGHRVANEYYKQLVHWLTNVRDYMVQSASYNPYVMPSATLPPIEWVGTFEGFWAALYKWDLKRPKKSETIKFFEKYVWNEYYEKIRGFPDVRVEGKPLYEILDDKLLHALEKAKKQQEYENFKHGYAEVVITKEVMKDLVGLPHVYKPQPMAAGPQNLYDWYVQNGFVAKNPVGAGTVIPRLGQFELELNIVGGPRDGEIIKPWIPADKQSLSEYRMAIPTESNARRVKQEPDGPIPTLDYKVYRFRIYQTRPTGHWWLGRYEIRWNEREEV